MPRKPSGNFDQNAYVQQYIKEHIKRRLIPFNMDKPEDKAIWDWLEGMDNITEYIKRLIRDDMKRGEKTVLKINFEAGESRDGKGINFMVCLSDPDLYAEIAVPENGSEDYGYTNLKNDILRIATEKGISADQLSFWYDGQEQYLSDDAYIAET